MLLLTARDAGAHDLPVRSSSPRASSRSRTPGLISGFSEAPQDISFAGDARRAGEARPRSSSADPDVDHAVVVHRRRAAAPATPARCSSRCKPARRAQERPPTRSSRRLRPEAVAASPASRCSCSRCRTCASAAASVAHAVPVHAAGRRPRRAARPGRRKVLERLRKLPELRDVNTDQQTAGLQLTLVIDRDTRRAARHHAAGHRRHALRRLRPAAGLDDRTRSSTSTASCWRSTPELAGRAPTRSTHVYVRGRGRRAGAARRHRPLRARADAARRSTTRGSSPPSTLSFNLAPGRRARRRRRRDPTRAERADRPAGQRCTPSFQGTAQAFRASLASEPLLILAALVHRLHRARHALRELIHPITILSTLPSAGVGALLALLICRTRVQHHRADRHHPADRHRQEERDHDDRLRARGRARARACARARRSTRPCLLRFRPIMMTTMAALLGALPLALGIGAGSELRRPLGIAIVGGLLRLARC